MKLKVIIVIFSLLILGITTLSAINYYKAAKSAAIAENHRSSQINLNQSAKKIDADLQGGQGDLSVLVRLTPILSVLTSKTPGTITLANHTLIEFQKQFPGSIIYLLDSQGIAVASSNHQAKDSFVGHNYAFRPYFRNALKGQEYSYPALGITSNRKGLYLSRPVIAAETREIIGVAVLKLSTKSIEEDIFADKTSGIYALINPEGLIFISSDPAMENRFLLDLPPEEKLKAMGEDRQFGSGPWTSTGLRKTDLQKVKDQNNTTYTIHKHPLTSLPGWELTYLHDNNMFAAQLTKKLHREIGLFLAALLLIINLSVFLLYNLAKREILEKSQREDQLLFSKQQLEEQIRKATEEIAYNNKITYIINQVLSLALEDISLQKFLNEFIKKSVLFLELGLQPKGALFLVEEDHPETLVLKASLGLAPALLDKCNNVKFGHCLCGRAAQDRKVLFVSEIDERHDNSYQDIKPHGHYCIPILSPDGSLIGLYNVYTMADAAYDQRVEYFLVTISKVLAGIIRAKQVDLQIRESEEQRRAITDTAHDAIITIDHRGRTTFWNPAAERIFGYSREEVLGRDLHDLITLGKYMPDARRGLEKYFATGKGPLIGNSIDVIGKCKDGSEVEIELSLSALHQNAHWSAVAILRDITARKKTEAEKTQLQSQLRQAQKMEAIGTLAGGIAHDFNNILSSILGYAELVRDELPEACATSLDDLDQVIKAGNRAKDLVRQILTFSRQTEEEFVPVQISLIVKEALKLLRASLPSSIEIKQLISDGSQTVFSDPSQVHQVLMNLCTNAFKAMREKGGVLEVRLESFTPDKDFRDKYPDLRAKRYVILLVSDTGIGMDSSILPRIFEPYFSTNKKEDGTGLGLALVHGIITHLGGVIEVESTVNVGSTFRVFMPIIELTDQKDSTREEFTVILPRGSEHLLLVDDEQPILEMLSRMVSGHGYQVSCRTSSIEALELFRNKPNQFDMVITDQNMPNMTGLDMADQIKKIRPGIPIILCTGYADLNLGQSSRSGSIQGLIMKPTTKSQLLTTVRQILDDS